MYWSPVGRGPFLQGVALSPPSRLDPSIHPSIHPSIYLSIYLSIYIYIYIYIHTL